MSRSATKRVLTVLEGPLFRQVSTIAKRDGLSMSQKVRDLVRDAIDRDEDADLTAIVESRIKGGGRWISHDAFWRKVGVK